MTREEFSEYMKETFVTLVDLNKKAQKEYTLTDNAFDNFERVGRDIKLDRKKVLLVYLKKHLDGVTSFCNGHQMQRESVFGRIDDSIVYLMLLRGMCSDDAEKDKIMDDIENNNDVMEATIISTKLLEAGFNVPPRILEKVLKK